MSTQEVLGLRYRFESTHAPLPHSRWLMRNFRPIIGILTCIVDRIRDQFPMRNSIASQLMVGELHVH